MLPDPDSPKLCPCCCEIPRPGNPGRRWGRTGNFPSLNPFLMSFPRCPLPIRGCQVTPQRLVAAGGAPTPPLPRLQMVPRVVARAPTALVQTPRDPRGRSPRPAPSGRRMWEAPGGAGQRSPSWGRLRGQLPLGSGSCAGEGLGPAAPARGERAAVGELGNRKRFIRREWWSRARQEDAGIRNIFAPAPFPVPGGRRASRAERAPPGPQPSP